MYDWKNIMMCGISSPTWQDFYLITDGSSFPDDEPNKIKEQAEEEKRWMKNGMLLDKLK